MNFAVEKTVEKCLKSPEKTFISIEKFFHHS
jgi:hypothetical protein